MRSTNSGSSSATARDLHIVHRRKTISLRQPLRVPWVRCVEIAVRRERSRATSTGELALDAVTRKRTHRHKTRTIIPNFGEAAPANIARFRRRPKKTAGIDVALHGNTGDQISRAATMIAVDLRLSLRARL